MAAPFGAAAGWRNLRQLVEFFVLMGCTLNEVPHDLEGPDGVHQVRYLFSHKTKDFVSLADYEDDEFVPPSEVENWERRLGFRLDGTEGAAT